MFEIYKDKAGEFRFRLKAKNGEIILASEGYKRKTSCLNGVNSVKTNSVLPSRYEVLGDENGLMWVNLKARNGRVIGVTEMLDPSSIEVSINSIKTNAPDAEVKIL